MKEILMKKWRAFWNGVRVLLEMDVRVFDDSATLIGGSVRPETAQMVKEAYVRANVQVK